MPGSTMTTNDQTSTRTTMHGIMSYYQLTSRMIPVVVLAVCTKSTISLQIIHINLEPLVAPDMMIGKTTNDLLAGITDGTTIRQTGANRLLQVVIVTAAVEWGVLGQAKDILQPQLAVVLSPMMNALVPTVLAPIALATLTTDTRH